jgi:hypothetical protein
MKLAALVFFLVAAPATFADEKPHRPFTERLPETAFALEMLPIRPMTFASRRFGCALTSASGASLQH